MIGIVSAVALLLWPLTAVGDRGLPPARSTICGTALDRGPAYQLVDNSAEFAFVARSEYQVILDCDDLRARNRWSAIGVAAAAVLVVMVVAVTRARRRSGDGAQS
jgi:hypothetical protein